MGKHEKAQRSVVLIVVIKRGYSRVFVSVLVNQTEEIGNRAFLVTFKLYEPPH
jgi:hypothetical protein